jgi:recombination protein RecR
VSLIFSPLIDRLIEGLRCLPGIGPKSAQRIAFHLLERNRDGGLRLSEVLQDAMHNIRHCQRCRNFSEAEYCTLCANLHRDQHLLCVVETPLDVIAIEQTAHYRGYYFVLQGHLSPLDGIGPQELGLPQLIDHIKNQPLMREIILATNSTVEGEVTAHHIAQLVKPLNITVSRIAHGVPMGGELEYSDVNTLSLALSRRTPLLADN